MNRAAAVAVAALIWSALLLVGGFIAGWWWRGDRATATESTRASLIAGAALDQVNATRSIEHAAAGTMAAIGAKLEEDRKTAEAVPAAVVAQLRDGTLRLRDDLATCHTDRLSEAAAGAAERDARAELRPEVAGAVVRIVTDAEHDIIACQAVIEADRAAIQ